MKKRILVVEDDAALARVLRDNFEYEGFEVDWVADSDGRGHHLAMTQVASLGWAASDRFGISAELWGNWDWDPDGTTSQYSADGSIAYLVNEGLQIDVGANFGLNRQTPDLELYAGISKRF